MDHDSSSGSDNEGNKGGGGGVGKGVPSSPDEYAAAVLAAHQHALEVYPQRYVIRKRIEENLGWAR